MKERNGWVSNSSSSSFCFIGYDIPKGEKLNPKHTYYIRIDHAIFEGESGIRWIVVSPKEDSKFADWFNTKGKKYLVDKLEDPDITVYRVIKDTGSEDCRDILSKDDIKKLSEVDVELTIHYGECDQHFICDHKDLEEEISDNLDDSV